MASKPFGSAFLVGVPPETAPGRSPRLARRSGSAPVLALMPLGPFLIPIHAAACVLRPDLANLGALLPD